MIELKEIAREIETALNNNGYGLNFAIFTDAAEYKNAFKSRTEKKLFTNGLIRVGVSSIVPTQGLTVATQDCTIEFGVQLFNAADDEKTISDHRAVLDAYFQNYRVDPMYEKDADGNIVKTYAVSSLYSFANTGTVEIRPNLGTSLTFSVNASFAYIENGLNSLNCTFELDGIKIPYSSARITKTPTPQSDAFSDSKGRAESVNVSFVRSFDFQMPAQSSPEKNGIGEIIIGQLLGDDLNAAHKLVVTLGDRVPETFDVIFAETNMSFEGINNAGHTLALIELLPDTDGGV